MALSGIAIVSMLTMDGYLRRGNVGNSLVCSVFNVICQMTQMSMADEMVRWKREGRC